MPLKKSTMKEKKFKIVFIEKKSFNMLLMTSKSCPTSRITLKKNSCTTLSTQTTNIATHMIKHVNCTLHTNHHPLWAKVMLNKIP